MTRDERGYPLVSHQGATGADCGGYFIVEERGDAADIVCNECHRLVQTLPTQHVKPFLAPLASLDIWNAPCPHCGCLYAFPGFKPLEIFVCRECGKSVSISKPIRLRTVPGPVM